MADNDDLDPAEDGDRDLEYDGRPHAPGRRVINAQDRLAEGWSPQPIAVAPDGGPVPIPQHKLRVLQDEEWICLRGPCRHYHRMVTSFDAQRPMPARGPNGELVNGELEREPRATAHTCYPSPGIEFSMQELSVYECNLWDPIVRTNEGDLERELRRMEYVNNPAARLEYSGDELDDVSAPEPSQSIEDDGENPFRDVPEEIMDGGVLGRHAAYKVPTPLPAEFSPPWAEMTPEAEAALETQNRRGPVYQGYVHPLEGQWEWYGHFTNPRTGQDWWVVARDIKHATEMIRVELGPDYPLDQLLLESVAEPASVKFKIHREGTKPFTAILSDVASGHIVMPGPHRTLSLPHVLPPVVELEKHEIPPAFEIEAKRAYYKVESVDGETVWHVVARDRAHAINVVERDPLLEAERQVMWWALTEKEAAAIFIIDDNDLPRLLRRDRPVSSPPNLTDVAVGRYITNEF